MKVAIIGFGHVGKSMKQLFPDAYVYDPQLKMGSKKDANEADISFICVPSPTIGGGKLDISIVEEVVAWCKCPLIVIRSTVNPHDCDYLHCKYGKKIVFQPEFLGETPNHPLIIEKNNPFLVIGGKPKNRRKLIELYSTVYNSNVIIRQLTNYEAEVAKLSENRAIGFKVMQLHELYLVCEKAGVDYYAIRDTVYGDDPRFNLWFSFIYPDKLGFDSSKCLVKDIPAWCSWAESVGFDPEVTKFLVKKSNDYKGIKV